MALTAGLAKDCAPNSGGIQRIALANVADITTISQTSGTIDTITMNGSAVFFEIQVEQDSAEWRENGELVNGSLKYTQELEFYVRKNNATTAAALREIGENLCGMVAIVLDTNGLHHVIGWSENLQLERPLKLASEAQTTGKELTDQAGSVITLTAMSDEKCYPSSVTLASLI
jgi:hypothetical protein